MRFGFFRDGKIPSTLYIGGGTPSLLSAEDFQEIAAEVMMTFGTNAFEEFTVEVNPDDMACGGEGEEKMLAYRMMGVNRISIGIQSFNDSHLKWMNRRHTAFQAKEAFNKLRECGFKNISVDLIFGYKGLSDEDWEEDLSTVSILSPEHISCYQMSIEPNSSLAGTSSLLSDEQCARQYEMAQKHLAKEGYKQYEVSNFCLSGWESKHNSNYWKRAPYLGLGPAAHSFDGGRRRSWNVSDLSGYCSDAVATEAGSEILTDKELFNETLMLGLRMTKGVRISALHQSCPSSEMFLKDFMPVMETEIAGGNIIRTGDIIRIPPEKLFVSDDLISNLII